MAFVGKGAIEEMNGKYRGHDYPTDVLSFTYGSETAEGVPYLGDIVIALEVASDNAARWQISPDKEVRKLIVHGVLHLLGYDHETDLGEMDRLQARLLRRRYFVGSEPVMVRAGLPALRRQKP